MMNESSRSSDDDRVIILNGKGSSSSAVCCSIIIISTSVLTFFIILFFFSSSPAGYYYYLPSSTFNNSNPPPIISFPHNNDTNGCNFFTGRWIEDEDDDRLLLLYNSSSCGTIPVSKNCFLHGRPDAGFLKWRWRPDGCGRLDRFDPGEFLEVVRGKKAAFVGDSVARNQVESLLCMLATVEVPVDVYKDAKDRSRTWYFAEHNFTLMVLWTKFLVKAKERGINGKPLGTFDLQMDQVDDTWANHLSGDREDLVIVISASQWFFRENYLYRQGQLMGCTLCSSHEPNLTRFEPSFAVGMALRTSLGHIIDTLTNTNTNTNTNTSSNHHHHVIIVRTISPSHFENGTWKTGGSCNRKRPFHHEDKQELYLTQNSSDLSDQWEVRKVQMKELTKARQRADTAASNCKSSSSAAPCNKFPIIKMEALDITWAMLMRPDGHPGHFWRDKQNKKKNGYNDCVHWCLPGPIDTWNYFLLPLLKKQY